MIHLPLDPEDEPFLTPSPEPDALIRLDDSFAYAFLGITIPVPRCVYSLTLIVQRVQREDQCSPERAQQHVFELVTDMTEKYGDRAPVFLDDAVSRAQSKPAILGRNGRRVN